MADPTTLFLIYALSDQSKVLSLYERLRAAGFAPWIDLKDIVAGQRRAATIEKALREADFILACLSQAAVTQRGFLQRQFRDAVALQKGMLDADIYLIPVRLEECELPEFFTDLQRVDLFAEDGWTNLLRAIEMGIHLRKRVTPKAELKTPALQSRGTPSESLVADSKWEVTEQPDSEGAILRFPTKDSFGKLQFRFETPHFTIHFGFRNSTQSEGIGRHGVIDHNLITHYADALETAYSALTAEPWSRQPPTVGPHGKTVVYILDTNSFITYDAQLVPFLCLPTNNADSPAHTDRQLAELEAIHQVVHLFNFRERPLYDFNSMDWAWFDEAFAFFIEMVVSPDNPATLRVLSDWFESPHMPLDQPPQGNHAVMFLRYIADRLGFDFVNRWWTTAELEENPFEALMRLLPEGQVFSSSDPNVHDLFASGYCMDSYFLADQSSASFMPEADQRYGGRAAAKSISLGPGETFTTGDVLNHLSCKYYRIYPKPETTRLSVTLTTDDSISPLKAEAGNVLPSKCRGEVERMQIVIGTDGREQLHCEMPVQHGAIDHLVVVVSNCAVTADQNDNKKFVLRFAAP